MQRQKMRLRDAPQLSSPFPLKPGTRVKNRLFKSAMSEQLGDKRHNPTQALDRLYTTWARGGIGLAVTGNVMVDRSALGEPKNVVLDARSDLSSFQRWAAAGKQHGTHLWMQLNHPGKQIPRFLSREPVAPSAVPLGAGLDKAFNLPRELSEAEILDIIEKFATSAGLAKRAGFSGVQIHGAHGYLVSQFLSPHHNRRNDRWGGGLENRMRFVREVLRRIRETVGEDFPVGIKLNSADFMKGGFSPEDSMAVAERLQAEGIDLIEISGGTYERPAMMGSKPKNSTLRREAYFLEFAQRLRRKIDIPLVVTGGFRSGLAMQKALESAAVDMIGMARPLALEPDLPNKLMAQGAYAAEFENPTTGYAFVDKMTMLSITWYEAQLARIAKGGRPDPHLSPWRVVAGMLGRTGVHAFARRRA